uniref:Uncharacterized protein n=1 Tax=viral metagenome TaxID=1070528 RepID=A0A6H1ZGU9_9ZZZZ
MVDAYGAYAMDWTDIDAAMDEYYRMGRVPAQFTRQGTTSRWFTVRGEKMKGKRYHFKVYIQPPTGTRRENLATAATGEFPAARDLAHLDMSYDDDDMTVFWLTVKPNELQDIQSEDRKHTIFKLSQMLISEAERDAAGQVNSAIHQASTNVIGTVKALYNDDGTSYTGGQTDGFIRMTDGAINQINKGERLDIYDSDGVTFLVEVIVNDVIYGLDGPYRSGSRVASIGPGIVVTQSADSPTALDLISEPAVGDFIARSSEYTQAGTKGLHGLPDWFSPNADVYNDEGGTAITRDAKGYAWQLPEIVYVAAPGSEVTFDMDTHLAQLDVTLPYRVKNGRNGRRIDIDEGISMPEALVAITTPSIAREATTDATSTIRFTTAAEASMSGAERKRLFGVTGFDGIVWRSPNLGHVAIQSDTAARPFKVDIIDPQSFHFLTLGGQDGGTLPQQGLRWLRNPKGGRFERVRGTNNRPTFYVDAGAWTSLLLFCDQIGANAEIQGVKGSI